MQPSTLESEFIGIQLRTFRDGIRWVTIWPSHSDPSHKRALEATGWTRGGSIRKARRILAYRHLDALLSESLPRIYRLCYTRMMSKMTIMVGIPGSGKSTLARKMRKSIVVSSDDIRERLSGDINDQSQNDRVFKIFAQEIKDGLKRGDHVVVDSTAVTRRAHELLLDIARWADVFPTLVIFTNTEQARRRNQNRARIVPDHVMDRMEENLQDIRHFIRENESKYGRIIEVEG